MNFSYNSIMKEGVTELLGMLDSRVVTEINLAGCGHGVMRELGFFMEDRAPPNLRKVDLSYCPYAAEDLEQFIRYFEPAAW